MSVAKVGDHGVPSEAGCCSVEFDIDRVTPERECELGLQLDDDPRLVLEPQLAAA